MFDLILGDADWLPYRLMPRQIFPPKGWKKGGAERPMLGGLSAQRTIIQARGPEIIDVGFTNVTKWSNQGPSVVRTLAIQLGFSRPFETREISFARKNFAQWQPIGSVWVIPIKSATIRGALSEVLTLLDYLFFEPFFIDHPRVELHWRWPLPERAIENVERFVAALNHCWDFEGAFRPTEWVVPGLSDAEIDAKLSELFETGKLRRRTIDNHLRISVLRHNFSQYDTLIAISPDRYQRYTRQIMGAIKREYPRFAEQCDYFIERRLG